MSKITRIGIAGLGHIGRRHLQHALAIGLAVVTADPKVSAEEAAELGSAAHYGDYREMFTRERPNAVIVGLPSHMHRVCAIAALKSGAHALVEKPLALTVEDADGILVEARACGLRVMAAHVCRFMGQNVIAKETLEGGELGRPLFFSAWRNTPTPAWSAGNWIGDRSMSGGTVMDLMIHDIDLACWLMGPVNAAALVQRQGGAQAGSGFYHAVSSLGFENGAAATLEAGHLMPATYVFTNGYRLVCEGGALEFTLRGYDPAMVLYEKDRMTDLTAAYKARWSGKNAYRDELEHFMGCLETGEEFRVTDEDARRAVGTVARLLNSEIF